MMLLFFFKQKTAYEIKYGHVGSEMCIRDRYSNECASQGLVHKPPWRNKGEGPRPGARGGIPRPLQSAEGAPPARLARRAGEVEHERTR